MKKQKLRHVHQRLSNLPLVQSSVLFQALGEALASHLYTLYRDTVTFSFTEQDESTYVECDVARLISCLRLLIDSAESEEPILLRLSMEEESAALSITMHRTRSLVGLEIMETAMLGGFDLYENDEGAYIRLKALKEQHVHLFAIDRIRLDYVFKEIDAIFQENSYKM